MFEPALNLKWCFLHQQIYNRRFKRISAHTWQSTKYTNKDQSFSLILAKFQRTKSPGLEVMALNTWVAIILSKLTCNETLEGWKETCRERWTEMFTGLHKHLSTLQLQRIYTLHSSYTLQRIDFYICPKILNLTSLFGTNSPLLLSWQSRILPPIWNHTLYMLQNSWVLIKYTEILPLT